MPCARVRLEGRIFPLFLGASSSVCPHAGGRSFTEQEKRFGRIAHVAILS